MPMVQYSRYRISQELPMRPMFFIMVLLHVALAAGAFAPRAALLPLLTPNECYFALADGRLHLEFWSFEGSTDDFDLPAPGITTLAVGRWRGRDVLLGARGRELLRYDMRKACWRRLGRLPEMITRACRTLLPQVDIP